MRRRSRRILHGHRSRPSAGPGRVIVEVDGGYHGRRKIADARRDEKLRRWGWRVVRVSARDVMGRLSAVVREIERALGK